jgi:rhodanese-related sulfurtransferase
MPSPTEITVAQLSRLVGLPGVPVLADVRTDEEFNSDPQLIPTAHRHASTGVEAWCRRWAGGQSVVVLCQSGGTSSQAVAARLRHEGHVAQTLEGGYDAWRGSRQLLVQASRIPRRDDGGRTVWVTRARPKVVRVACPWLIRRFVDPSAVFLFVPPAEVAGVAEHAKATPFDIEGVFWSDRGRKDHLRCHGRRVWPCCRAACQIGVDCSGRRHRQSRFDAAVSRLVRNLSRLLAHVP